MSSIKNDLFPDQRMLIQFGIYVATLISAHYFFIKPSLRLYRERNKRTAGMLAQAKAEDLKALSLETGYHQEFQSAKDSFKSLKMVEITSGQKTAENMINDALSRSKSKMESLESQIKQQVDQERSKIKSISEEIASQLLTKLSHVFLFALCFTYFSDALASDNHFMESVIWPYFQFGCYLVLASFLAKKIIPAVLEKMRDNLRTQLIEAKEALQVASQKSREYEVRVSSLQSQLEDLKKQYLLEGQKERDKIVHDAKLMADQILVDSEKMANDLISKSKEELRKEVINTSLEVLKKKLQNENLKQIDKRLIGEALEKVQTIH